MLYSTPILGGEADLLAQTTTGLNQILGSLSDVERARRLGAVPAAMQVGRQIQQMPLETMQAISSVSPILKALEEEPYKFGYEQFMREQLWPYQYQYPVTQQLLDYAPWYYPMYQQKASPFQQIVGGAGTLAPLLMMGGGGGGSTIPYGSTSYGGGSWGMATPLPF
jgi:hypothetical protein